MSLTQFVNRKSTSNQKNKTMDMQSVDSSNIDTIGYDPNSATLRISFKTGGMYEYYDVPQHEYDGLMGADSKGSYANKNIYKSYTQQKIG